jgi:hypothetical protein
MLAPAARRGRTTLASLLKLRRPMHICRLGCCGNIFVLSLPDHQRRSYKDGYHYLHHFELKGMPELSDRCNK